MPVRNEGNNAIQLNNFLSFLCGENRRIAEACCDFAPPKRGVLSLRAAEKRRAINSPLYKRSAVGRGWGWGLRRQYSSGKKIAAAAASELRRITIAAAAEKRLQQQQQRQHFFSL